MKRGGIDEFEGENGVKSARTGHGATISRKPKATDFSRGISLHGLKQLAIGAGQRSVREMWREVWIHQTVAEGWTVAPFHDDQGVFTHQTYLNSETNEQVTTQRKVSGVFENEGELPECKTLMDARAADLAPFIGAPTHLLSHPWSMSMEGIVEAAEDALRGSDADSAFFWFGMLSHNYHNTVVTTEEDIGAFESAFKASDIVQVCSSWNDPERLGRLWMLYESCLAVANDRALLFGFDASERGALADALRLNGPDAILTVVYNLSVIPEGAKLRTNREDDRAVLEAGIAEFASQCGGKSELDLKLREQTRQTYASAIEREFERRWALLFGGDVSSSSSSSSSSLPPSPPPNLEQQWQTLDLGHQLACLWAITDASDRAEVIFRRVLQRIKAMPVLHDGNNHIARSDRTAAELVKLLRRSGETTTQEAHRIAVEVSGSGELPVSWEGISVEFVETFLDDHGAAVEFLSTDAVVERVIKPTSRSPSFLYDPDPKGKALIEMAHDRYKGSSSFFLSHAWRQTFSVSTSEYRGGLAQAIIHSVPECERATTYFWSDIFCVNQHLRSPHGGGLLAFAFEPLRNAMVNCGCVKIFLERWDDPAPLGRVWCLDELRNALLLGKDVEIIMPPQAMRSFQEMAKGQPTLTIQDIERVVARIDVKHASATFRSDREFVFRQVEETLGSDALSSFCKEIFRDALTRCAGIADSDASLRDGQWETIFEKLERKAREGNVEVPKAIAILRAVAMMRLRRSKQGTPQYSKDQDALREVATMALRFYGAKSQLYGDIMTAMQLCV